MRYCLRLFNMATTHTYTQRNKITGWQGCGEIRTLCTVVKWYSHYEKHYGGPQKAKNRFTM